MDELSRQVIATLLVSLRIAPAFAFAPPFTLLRVPALVRLALSVAISLWLVSLYPDQTWRQGASSNIAVSVLAELFLGISLALALQLAFAALLTAGRAIDIQAGFGLSLLIDPTTRTQVPLAGTLLSYAAGAVFFLTSGPADLLALLAGSVQQVPVGTGGTDGRLEPLLAYSGSVFMLAFGAAGLIILTLFIVDLAIAFMSRTLPQMNVMLLGFQVKTLVVLAILPVAIGLSAGLLLRVIRSAFQAMASLV
jgi:flagellar biosynthetic protein FliR